MSPVAESGARKALRSAGDVFCSVPTTIATYYALGVSMLTEITQVATVQRTSQLSPAANFYTDEYIDVLQKKYEPYRLLENVIPQSDNYFTPGELGFILAGMHLFSRNLNFDDPSGFTNPLSRLSANLEEKQAKLSSIFDNALENHPFIRTTLRQLARSLEYSTVILDPLLPSAAKLLVLGVATEAYIDNPAIYSALLLLSTIGTIITINDIIRITGKSLDVLQKFGFQITADEPITNSSTSTINMAKSSSKPGSNRTKSAHSTGQHVQIMSANTDEGSLGGLGIDPDQALLHQMSPKGNRKSVDVGSFSIVVESEDDTHLGLVGPQSESAARNLAAELRSKGVKVAVVDTDKSIGGLGPKTEGGAVVIAFTRNPSPVEPSNEHYDREKPQLGATVITFKAVDDTTIVANDILTGKPFTGTIGKKKPPSQKLLK